MNRCFCSRNNGTSSWHTYECIHILVFFLVRVFAKYLNFNKTQKDNSNQMFHGVITIMVYAFEIEKGRAKKPFLLKSSRVYAYGMSMSKCDFRLKFCAQTYSKTRFSNMDMG